MPCLLLGIESAFQKFDQVRGSFGVQVNVYGAKALRHKLARTCRLVSGDVPIVAKRVLHASFAVAVWLIYGFVRRGRTGLERTLVDRVGVAHVQMNRSGS